ncbi:formate dehydrogenase subunit gamma [Roseibium salinum]|uniref:Formate dehydrogenase subunit gamma n=1 Tax=Roseibium salinum TaxID=1604349 RepID=A0ABT3R0J3_9HYPH|nr:formate dehydrogenase subunit gamma [Roseibium sp. DSM 29163]MCX2722684.1 formate dehydrogenase subunit gamma [Roseibium sp. DSM 29163]
MTRSIAGICAVLLLALFAYTIYLATTSNQLVVPTNGVIGSSGVDDPAEGQAGLEALTARTGLQRWRAQSGPSPEAGQAVAPTKATPGDADTPPASAGVAQPRGMELTQEWLSQRNQQEEILQTPQFVQGVTSLPEAERNVFVQPQGRDWRSSRNGPILFGGGLYIFGVAALLAIFLAVRGRVPLKEGFSGRTVPRFNAVERANHWMTAGSFVLMALTGLIVLYGKSVIRPWLGAEAFADLTRGSVWVHMAMILPFTLGLLVMIGAWLWQNLPSRLDWQWLKHGGGFLSDRSKNPPARRFNAGQKLVFWAVILGGTALIVSGLTLMFPFLWAGYDGMQLAQTIHVVVALLMIGVIFGHIYIGTIGMVGAFDAMWSGRVDRNWAKEHHSLWYRRRFEEDTSGKNQPAE